MVKELLYQMHVPGEMRIDNYNNVIQRGIPKVAENWKEMD